MSGGSVNTLALLTIVGTIPEGFRLKDGVYSDMHIMYLPFN
ncbi:hypothetical protein [Lachnoclostridium phytofermentans]|nr:hypothetical protein [Lachnoclostridium phytofermentans]